MIEAKSLRLGNIVEIYKGNKEGFTKPCEVIKIDSVSVNDYDIDDIHPIPLTEEIMINMGFSSKYKSCGYSFYKDGVYFTNQDEDGEGNPIDNFIFYVSLDYKYDRIYFVHQLQNRFYSLTGEELTVNL